MQSKNTAIVLVDVNNDFLSKDGKLYTAVKDIIENNQVIAHINKLINTARKKGIMIIYVPIEFSSDYYEMGTDPYGIFKTIKDNRALQRGTPGGSVATVLDVHPDDIVVTNKSTTCAFATTKLDQILKENEITHIALGGLLTNICIETTMRTAYDKGYKVYSLTDCCATVSKEQHEDSIKNNWPMLSLPMLHDEFINQIENISTSKQ